MIIFLAAIGIYVLGVCLHVIFYAPTAALPPIWRNLARYVSGVATVLLVEAMVLILYPTLTIWEAFGLQVALFGLCGLGVATGYLIAGD